MERGYEVGEVQERVDALVESISARDALLTFYHLNHLDDEHLALPSSRANKAALEAAFQPSRNLEDDDGLAHRLENARGLIIQVLLLKGLDPWTSGYGRAPVDVAQDAGDQVALGLMHQWEAGTYSWSDAESVLKSKPRELEGWLKAHDFDREERHNKMDGVEGELEIESDDGSDDIFLDAEEVFPPASTPSPNPTRNTISIPIPFLSKSSINPYPPQLSLSTSIPSHPPPLLNPSPQPYTPLLSNSSVPITSTSSKFKSVSPETTTPESLSLSRDRSFPGCSQHPAPLSSTSSAPATTAHPNVSSPPTIAPFLLKPLHPLLLLPPAGTGLASQPPLTSTKRSFDLSTISQSHPSKRSRTASSSSFSEIVLPLIGFCVGDYKFSPQSHSDFNIKMCVGEKAKDDRILVKKLGDCTRDRDEVVWEFKSEDLERVEVTEGFAMGGDPIIIFYPKGGSEFETLWGFVGEGEKIFNENHQSRLTARIRPDSPFGTTCSESLTIQMRDFVARFKSHWRGVEIGAISLSSLPHSNAVDSYSIEPNKSNSQLYVTGIKTNNQPDHTLRRSLRLVLGIKGLLGFTAEHVLGISLDHSKAVGKATALVKIDSRLDEIVWKSIKGVEEREERVRRDFNSGSIEVNLNWSFYGDSTNASEGGNPPSSKCYEAPPSRSRSQPRRPPLWSSSLPQRPRSRSRSRSPLPRSNSGILLGERSRTPPGPDRSPIQSRPPPRGRSLSPHYRHPSSSILPPSTFTKPTTQTSQLLIAGIRTLGQPDAVLKERLSFALVGRNAKLGFAAGDIEYINIDRHGVGRASAWVQVPATLSKRVKEELEWREERDVKIFFNGYEIGVKWNAHYVPATATDVITSTSSLPFALPASNSHYGMEVPKARGTSREVSLGKLVSSLLEAMSKPR
ncbi:hypothetical protein P7C70_g2262, partial [Phenoliferia sp. Uapishka_3]